MSSIDDLIGSDLTALGDQTQRELPDSAAIARLLTGAGDPYRDDRPGAEARKRALLDRRLHELAFMPLACERIFVHRVARAAAGGSALAAVCIAVLVSMDVWSQRLIYALFDRPTAPLAATLLAGGVLAAYVVAGLFAERYYERRMRATLEPAGTTFEEVDKLAQVGPTDEAHRLIDRVDAVAVALPLAGVIASGLLLGVLVFFSDPGYPVLALVAESSGHLLLYLVAGLAAAVLLGSAVARHRRGHDSVLVGLAEHWATLVVGGVALLAALWYASRTAFGLHTLDIIPTQTTSLLLGGIGALALLLPGAWLLLAVRRREHRRLGEL